MPIKATISNKGEGLNGEFQAVCSNVYDLEMQISNFNGHETLDHKVLILFEIIKRIPTTGKRFTVSKEYTLNLNKRSNLRKDLESWRGRPFDEKEINTEFDLENLIGVNCMLILEEKESNGKTFSNITAIKPLEKGLEKMTPEMNKNYAPEWVVKKIQNGKPVPVIKEDKKTFEEEKDEVPF